MIVIRWTSSQPQTRDRAALRYADEGKIARVCPRKRAAKRRRRLSLVGAYDPNQKPPSH